MTDTTEAPGLDEPESPPTPAEHKKVREAVSVVEPQARRVARMFPRIVRDDGLLTMGDLRAIGHRALYRAARNHDPARNPEFKAYAAFYAAGAMLNAVDGLLFEERMKCAAAKAKNNFAAFQTSDGYDVMKHDQADARRRFRDFANGVLAGTFTAVAEEAERCLDVTERELRREYERAIAVVHEAIAQLPEADRRMIRLMYGGSLHLSEASQALGVPYGTARVRHKGALKKLHQQLVGEGITQMPRPLVVPDVGGVLDDDGDGECG